MSEDNLLNNKEAADENSEEISFAKKNSQAKTFNELRKMPLTDHLEELRQALITSSVALLISAGLCFYFNEQLLDILTAPLINNIKGIQLIFVSPGEAFMATLRIAIITGIFISLPIILNRVYWFISPGLTKDEKRFSLPIIIFSYFLFILGLLFSYFALLPFGVKFLVEFAPANIHPMISIGNYISFSSTLLIATGIIFELPLLLLFLAFIRIVDRKKLKRFRKYAFLASFVIGAIVTPSVDIVTQSLLAGALYMLYEISIIVIGFLEISRAKVKIDENV